MLTSFVPPNQNIVQGNLFTKMDFRMFFSHGLHGFSLDWSFPLYIGHCYFHSYRFCQKKIIFTWGLPLELNSDRGNHCTGWVLWQSFLFGWFYYTFFCEYHPHSLGLVEHTNDTMKTQLAKFVATLQVSWPKILLLPLNLSSIPFETQTLIFWDGQRASSPWRLLPPLTHSW